jgi:ER lumen protein retaining receptor
MKVVFIGTTSAIVWYMRRHKAVKQTYDRDQDTFRSEFILAPCFLLALLTTHDYSPLELLWTFSILLEALAIMPQLVLLQRTGNVDNLTGSYVALLGSYRALYIANWAYRFFTEHKYRQVLVWTAGGVQTALYLDFFYYYVKSWQNNTKLCLPS